DRFMLVFCIIAGGKTDLGQSIVKACLFSRLCQMHVIVIAPVGTLFDATVHQAATDIRYPRGKYDIFIIRHIHHPLQSCVHATSVFGAVLLCKRDSAASKLGTAAEGRTSSCSICLLMPRF